METRRLSRGFPTRDSRDSATRFTVQSGQASALEGEQEILRMEQERLPVLQQIAVKFRITP
ncbi:MAG: hypothetical protein LBT74_13305 [Acidobacteriota bacterium]|jgi:hypothetical protein|nr:hypothetical protein [Acidobacteriota bacterium]